MSDRPILLLGSNGQVGFELKRSLISLGEVVALDIPDIDYTQPETLRPLVRELRPGVIVSPAAYTAVDKAEGDAEAARIVNAVAPGVLAEEAEALGAALVQYSTDYVFDGRKPSPYVESDQPAPLSVYGRTKLEGERAVQACSRHLIFRTSWVIGAHGKNFVKTMLRLAAEKDTLRVVADQFGRPTTAALLADVTAEVLRRNSGGSSARYGLYHLTGSGETSWHGLACYVIGRAAEMGLKLKARPETVLPITTADYPTPAVRPANSRLDTGRISADFGIVLPDWTVLIDAVLERIVPEMQS